MNFDYYLKNVINGEKLNAAEAYTTAHMLLHEDISRVKAAAFLSAMRTRKESYEELSGFVTALYEEAITIDTDAELIDTCGTGGDGLGTFNISTATALVVAACGIPVAKHGNRAASSKVGSADVLEALGVNVQLSPDEARRMLDKAGITFLFAPNYHPIMKQVGPLRREMGIATIFNFLGPLINPYKLTYQIMGISDPHLQEAIARTMMQLGRSRAQVVCADNGMDEISPNSTTRVYDVASGRINSYDINPGQLGIKAYPIEHIAGGDSHTNARIVERVIAGQTGPQQDVVVLNAAAALVTAGKASDMKAGMDQAREAIQSGRARGVLRNMISYSRDGVLVC